MHWFKDEWLPKLALSYNNGVSYNNVGRGHFLVPNSVGLNSTVYSMCGIEFRMCGSIKCILKLFLHLKIKYTLHLFCELFPWNEKMS